jgi:hypothetical protein
MDQQKHSSGLQFNRRSIPNPNYQMKNNIYRKFLSNGKFPWLKEGLILILFTIVEVVLVFVSLLIVFDYEPLPKIVNYISNVCQSTSNVVIKNSLVCKIPRLGSRPNPNNNTLLYCFALIYFVFGSYFAWVKFCEIWARSTVDVQIQKHKSIPENQNITFRLDIPSGFDPSTNDHKRFMLYLYEAFKSKNVTIESMLNQGKQYLELSFDYISHNGHLDVYVTFPRHKEIHVIEAFRRYFKPIALHRCPDPFLLYKSKLNMNPDLKDSSTGFCFSLTGSNVNPPMPLIYIDFISDPVKQLIGSYKENLVNQTIIMQYNFVFDTNIDYQKYNSEFDDHLERVYQRYNTGADGQGKLPHSFFPKEEDVKLNAMFSRLKSNWIGTSIRVLTIPDNVDGEQAGRSVESELRAYFEKSKLPLDINYLTSSNQSYYRYGKMQPEMQSIYNTYYYGPKIGEAIIAPWYERIYYPKENKLRREVLIKAIFDRKPNSPISHKFFYLDAESFSRYIYIGNVPSLAKYEYPKMVVK